MNSEFFFFNLYVYYLICGFIASTSAFNLPTGAFNLVTYTFSLLTRGFELVNWVFLFSRKKRFGICATEQNKDFLAIPLFFDSKKHQIWQTNKLIIEKKILWKYMDIIFNDITFYPYTYLMISTFITLQPTGIASIMHERFRCPVWLN